jgi:hypothetical protein
VGDRERELRASHRGRVAELAALLYRHDPIGIAFGDDPDEYAPEAGTIAVLLKDARTVDDVRAVVHAEFVRWFRRGHCRTGGAVPLAGRGDLDAARPAVIIDPARQPVLGEVGDRPVHLGSVRIRGPSSVTATVCSTCAARLPSAL